MMPEALLNCLPNLLALCLLTVLSGLISASETALFALSRQQLARFRESRRRAAQVVLRLREDPESLLSTVLLVNIAVNIFLYSMLAVTVARLGGASPFWTMVLGIAGFLVVLFGAEIVPKLFAYALSERLAPLVAVPIRALQSATWPIRRVLGVLLVEPLTRVFGGGLRSEQAVDAEDLRQLVNICQTEGLIDERENALLHQVMELADMRVAELMVPRVDVAAFDLAGDGEKLVELITASRLLRIPVYEGDIDNVKGMIAVKEFLLNRDRPLDALIRPAQFIPEQASVEALLEHFRTTGSTLALVVDEYGGVAGIVALEDVVEAIVGELHAPDEPEIRLGLQRVDETTFLIDAGLDVDDFCRAFDLPAEESRFHTVGGMIAAKLDRLPRPGDLVCIGPVRLTVVSMEDRRVLRARLTLQTPVKENPDLTRLLDLPGPVAQGDAPARRERP